MSSVVGHLGLGSDPEGRTATMLAACAARGSVDPQIATLSGPTSGQFAHAGHRATLHSEAEPRPFTHSESGVVITADIRLDNREVLRQELASNGRPVGDAELALLAYLRWGTAFAERLLGDFVVAVFDPRSGELIVSRDHFGIRPLLFAYGTDWFVFGSTLQSVRQGADRNFPVYIDRLQHSMLDPLEVAEPGATFFRGISYLRAATTMVWTPGAQPRASTYWKAQRGDLKLTSDREYNEAFLEVFDEAVSCRLMATRPVAAMLSGGLDSSSVVARAQTMVETPLRTYGFVESNPPPGSDAPHIEACQRAFRGDHVSFSEQEISDKYDLDKILRDPDSPFDVLMTVLWHAVQESAETGYGVLLTGIGGDEAVAVNPRSYAAELVRSDKRLQALREMARSDSRRQVRPLVRMALAELGPKRLVEFVRSRTAPPADFQATLMSAGFDPASDAGRRLQASFDAIFTDWDTGDPRLDRVARPMIEVGATRYDRVAARGGIEIRHPLLDKRFVEFCLSLPSSQLQNGGWSKVIIRRAIAELPQSVAWRPKEQVGMVPATRQVRLSHAPDQPVEPPVPGIFGHTQPNAATDPDIQWMRHVVSKWWSRHATG